MVIGGIDPGLKGALAFLDTTAGIVRIYDMPTIDIKNKTVPNSRKIAQICIEHEPAFVYVEDVYTSPQMGVVSAGNFMYGKAAIEAALSITGIATIWVHPSMWKKKMKLPADKKKTVERASVLFESDTSLFTGPRGGMLDGRAEAACLSLYGAFHQGESVSGIRGVVING